MLIKSNQKVNKPKMEWTRSNDPQPWHCLSFAQAATTGIEIVYTGSDVEINKKVVPPFKQINKHYFILDTSLIIKTPIHHNLLIVPHHSFYIEPKNAPLPIMGMLETDWWFKPIKLVFRMKHSMFKNNSPIAQAIALPKEEYITQLLSSGEYEQIKKTQEWFNKNKNKYITRSFHHKGVDFDNSYAILSNLAKIDKLPEEIKPKKKKLKLVT